MAIRARLQYTGREQQMYRSNYFPQETVQLQQYNTVLRWHGWPSTPWCRCFDAQAPSEHHRALRQQPHHPALNHSKIMSLFQWPSKAYD